MRYRRRQARRTIQIVGEGYAERYFLEHVRQAYLNRSGNLNMKISNARGKGGKAVLEYALRPQVRGGYDEVAILVDTDQDWSAEERARASAEGIVVLESSPCLERVLLAIHGRAANGPTAKQKRAFIQFFGMEAHDARVYSANFPKALIDQARQNIEMVDQLLKLLGE